MTDAGAGDVRTWLTSLELFGIKLGLDTIGAICHALGSPERARPAVHIAGTNGKGSVSAFVEAALRAAGYRTGRYTSPHLVRLEERFAVNGEAVPPGVLDAALTAVRAVVTDLQHAGKLSVTPTFFEITTAAAFEVFRAQGTDVNVFEVGLGGRFDATNVVTPRVSAITSIAFDHEEHLGRTLEAIAFEKAGIAKRGVPVVVGDVPAGAGRVIADVCSSAGAPVIHAVEGCRVRSERHDGRQVLDVSTPVRHYAPVALGLRGPHQVANAIVAVRVLETLDDPDLPVPEAAIHEGLARARWPARLDLRRLADGRSVLIDGAHNPSGARALAAYVAEEYPAGVPVVFGAMADKDLVQMLGALKTVARPLVLTTAPGRRAASTEQLARAARDAGVHGSVIEPVIDSALGRAWREGPEIVVAGSLYLAGRVMEILALE